MHFLSYFQRSHVTVDDLKIFFDNSHNYIITDLKIYTRKIFLFLEVEENISQRQIPYTRIDLSWIKPQLWSSQMLGEWALLK